MIETKVRTRIHPAAGSIQSVSRYTIQYGFEHTIGVATCIHPTAGYIQH